MTDKVVRDVGQQLCQMPQSNAIASLDLDGNSFTGEGIQILAGFILLCPCLKLLYSEHCGITSDDLSKLIDQLAGQSLSPSPCSNLRFLSLSNNEVGDSGVSALLDHLPLFPQLGCVFFWCDCT